jgi:hypothetical protein
MQIGSDVARRRLTSAVLETVPERSVGTLTFDSTTSNGGAGERLSASRALGAPVPGADWRWAFFTLPAGDAEASRAFDVVIHSLRRRYLGSAELSKSAGDLGPDLRTGGDQGTIAPLSLLSAVTQVKRVTTSTHGGAYTCYDRGGSSA